MNKLFIGETDWGSPLLPYENALLYYVYGRVTLNTVWFLFLLPSIFYFFHHSIEVSFKTLLKLKNVPYPTRGLGGHNISNLLKIIVDSQLFSPEVNELTNSEDLAELLTAMDKSYMNNKYSFCGYNINFPLREVVDMTISVIFREINSIMEQKTPPHASAKLYVTEPIEEAFLKDLKALFGEYHINSIREH
jgi:HEPN domain-containing protein